MKRFKNFFNRKSVDCIGVLSKNGASCLVKEEVLLDNDIRLLNIDQEPGYPKDV